MLNILLTVVLVLAFAWYFWQYESDKPPGPISLPILGTLLDTRRPFPKYFADLSQRFKSPVVAIEALGNDRYIVINDYNIIKECLTMKHVFSGRKVTEFEKVSSSEAGIIFLDYGNIYKEHRKFASKTLKMFGLGKSVMEEKILDELSNILEEISENVDKPFFIHDLLQHSTASAIYSVLGGETLLKSSELSPIGDTAISRQVRHLRENDRKNGMMRINYRFFKHIPSFKKFFADRCAHIRDTKAAIRKIVEEHERSFQKDHLRDFIDCFLVEAKDNNVLQPINLPRFILDFFLAGNETSATTLKWSLLYLLHYPQYLDRVHNEIDTIIGSRLPAYRDCEKMHFVRAFIQEIMRCKTIVPIVTRKCIAPVNVGGYHFPAQTPFFINIWAVHHDEKVFPNADKFSPERFLNTDGQFVKNDHVMPFSIGLRDCVGRRLAEMEIFIFLCGILQKFNILPSDKLPKLSSDVELVVTAPLKFDINFTLR